MEEREREDMEWIKYFKIKEPERDNEGRYVVNKDWSIKRERYGVNEEWSREWMGEDKEWLK